MLSVRVFLSSKTLRAISTLIGTTIGAGIFGIPYAFSQAGFGIGVFYLVVLGMVMLVLNLCYGEVILRTPGDHQLTGYGEIYLGKLGRLLGLAALLTAIYGALLAYIIQVGNFLGLLFNHSEFSSTFSLIFFAVFAVAVFLGLRLISEIEMIMVLFLIGLIFLIAVFGFSKITFSHFQPTAYSSSVLLLPYGVLIFALSGSSVIPEMEEILRDQHKKLKKSIILGTLIPALVYLLFATVVVGVSGMQTSPDAISGLAEFLSPVIVKIGAFLGVLAMSTSFLALGFVLKEMYFRDLCFSKVTAWICAVFPPLLLFLFGTKSFISVLEVTGAFMGGLTGILISILFIRARKVGRFKPEFTVPLPTAGVLLLAFIFLLGIFYQLIQVF